MTSDGRLGVLDFGSTLETPGGMPSTFLIDCLGAPRRRVGDPAWPTRRRVSRPGRVVDAGKLADYLAPFTEPARHEVFHFTRDWLRSEFGRVNDPRNPDFRRSPCS